MTARGTLHLPVNTLALRRGGLVKAVMMRANALVTADPQRHVVIEVLAFQPRLADDVAELVRDGHLDERVHVRSILRTLDPAAPGATATDPVVGCVHHEHPAATPDGRGSRRLGAPAADPALDPRAGVLAGRTLPRRPRPRAAVRADDGRRRSTEIFDRRGRLLRRDEQGSGGQVARMLEFRAGETLPVTQRWIGRDGRCFLTIWHPAGSRDWGAAFAVADGEVRGFGDMAALYRFALERALEPEGDPVLFSEFREGLPNIPDGFDAVVLSVRHPSLRRVAVLHSNHALQGQHRLPKRSSPKFSAQLTGLSRWDRVVVATEHQKAEIAEQYGNGERIAAIAHYGAPARSAAPAGDYDPNRFVLVARIHRKKRVDEAIEVFRLVVDENPQARLEIYGFGYGDALERQITELVTAHGLADHVTFRGFVADVAQIYAGACASLQTSESEGFGMALLESLAHGLPVVAYDVAYGAREVVRDGVDGFVVPWGERAAMARRLLELSADPELRARIAEAAPAGAARFSPERYVREWRELLTGLPRRIDARISGGALKVSTGSAGTLVVRPKNGSADVEAPLVDGAARAALPEVPVGTIVDLYVRIGEKMQRAAGVAAGPSDDPGWTVYVTEWGNLSLRRVRPPAAGKKAGAAAPTSLPARAVRRLRRSFTGRRLRQG